MESQQTLFLAEVFAFDYSPDQAAAYVRIHNPGPDPADLSGYILEWDATSLRFPKVPTLSAKKSTYVVQRLAAFRRVMARKPEHAGWIIDSRSMAAPGAPGPALNPSGGSVRLLSPDGTVVDAFVWGDITVPDGWNGPGAAPSDRGEVFQRAMDESQIGPGDCVPFVLPGGSFEAWRQGDAWIPRRLVKAGQGCFSSPSFVAESAVAFTAPDNALEAVKEFIVSAKEKIDVNIYLFTHETVAAEMEAAVLRGVKVRLLMEGQPVEGMPARDRANMERIQKAGGDVRSLRVGPDGFKRYYYDHAKYAVADGQRCLIMSDNWTMSSLPPDGATGKRGWGVILDSVPLAEYLTRVFDFDQNPRSLDSEKFDPGDPSWVPASEASGELPRLWNDPVGSLRVNGPIGVIPILAPEHGLLETLGISGFIRSARETLDIEQQSVQLHWGHAVGDSPETTPNLFLNEVVEAARRGVKVRLLMGGAYLDPENPHDNTVTREWLTNLARNENLPLQARILDYTATGMGIHNKGLLADGRRTLLSSINWSKNSPLNNREVGVILDSEDLTQYFARVFERDWAASDE